MNPSDMLLVAVGGAVGSVARYLVTVAAGRIAGPDLPLGTFAVNVIGSFAMGALIGLLALRYSGSTAIRLFFAVGILGGFTTFSSFALDAVVLGERGDAALAAAYVIGSVVLSLAALFGGLSLVRSFA